MEDEVESSYFLNKGARALCISEFFASFSYYGMVSILMLLFTGKMHLPNEISYHIIGNIIPVTLISAIAGGIIGYRYLPLPLAALFGLVSYTIGYFLLILISYDSITFESIGFAFVACGFGLFEPNVKVLYGNNYKKYSTTDRDIKFIIFQTYNVAGQFLGILALTYLLSTNPKYLFLTAGIVSLIGTLFFLSKYKDIRNLGYTNEDRDRKIDVPLGIAIAILMVLSAFYVLLQYYVGYIFSFVAMLVVVFFIDKVSTASPDLKIKNYKILVLLIGLFIGVFCIRQSFNEIEFFTNSYVSNTLLGFDFNKNFLKDVEPLSFILFFPILIKFTKKLNAKKPKFSSGIKLTSGLVMLSLSFSIIAISIQLTGNQKISSWWMIIFYLIMGAGELLIIPTVVSRLYSLSADAMKGVMMGLFFFFIGLSSLFGGFIGNYASNILNGNNLSMYQNFFNALIVVSLAFAIVLFAIWKILEIKMKK